MFRAFLHFAGAASSDTILDIGATSDREYDHSNYFEAWHPNKQSITAVGLDDASFLAQEYAGVRFLRADACQLPFRDESFDYAHSSAVLEHVGSRNRQVQFLQEAWRVSRKGVFVTTPNRWFPIEFHTLLPLLHWLPVYRYRAVLAKLDAAFFASEDNLNLLSARSLADIAHAAGITGQSFGGVALLGWPTNLILSARKQQARP